MFFFVFLFQVEELYDAYCIQRRLRDGASKMVAAFNSATGSKEARESLNEANKGYRECTEVSVKLTDEVLNVIENSTSFKRVAPPPVCSTCAPLRVN